ncbi:MAG: hypothetical protein SO011_00175 [Prevotella sp.]|nr:hypothetical protein [Prevotella sp.]
MRKEKYLKPTLEIVRSVITELLAGSGVFVDDDKIMDGSTDWVGKEEGNGDDAAAKGDSGWNLWGE